MPSLNVLFKKLLFFLLCFFLHLKNEGIKIRLEGTILSLPPIFYISIIGSLGALKKAPHVFLVVICERKEAFLENKWWCWV